jgi:hypothetical protein
MDDTVLQVIESNLSAYNNRDIDAFMRSFASDAVVIELKSGNVALSGVAAIRDTYSRLFRESPTLHSKILSRSVVGNLVTDHELVTGRAGGDLEILIIYEVAREKIIRIWVAREPATMR